MSKTRWDRLRDRREKPEPLDEDSWREQLTDCMQRLILHPDGASLLDLLFQRFVFAEQKLDVSESALRADMAVRNLVLLLDRYAHEGSADAGRRSERSGRDADRDGEGSAQGG